MEWIDGFASLTWRDWLLALIVLVAIYMPAVYFRLQHVRHAEAIVGSARSAFTSAPAAAAGLSAARYAAESFDGSDRALLERLQRESVQLRSELDALRASFAKVREELRQEISRLKAVQQVSPLYNDSMRMAQAVIRTLGLDPAKVNPLGGDFREFVRDVPWPCRSGFACA